MEQCQSCRSPLVRGDQHAKGRCRRCYMRTFYLKRMTDPVMRAKDKEYGFRYYREHRESESKKNAARNRALRMEAIAAYGGKCACCQETITEFLTLDHINGGGAQHRKRARGSTGTIYRDLRKQGWPTDNYQILCWNCNLAKAHWGVCPHIQSSSPKT